MINHATVVHMSLYQILAQLLKYFKSPNWKPFLNGYTEQKEEPASSLGNLRICGVQQHMLWLRCVSAPPKLHVLKVGTQRGDVESDRTFKRWSLQAILNAPLGRKC